MTRFLFVALTLAACGEAANPCAVKAVVHDHWKQPLAGVTVTSSEGKTATTDDRGQFKLACTTRPSSITIGKPGYSTFEQKLSPPRKGYEKSILATSIMDRLLPAPAKDGLYIMGDTTKQLVEVSPIKLEPGELVPDDAPKFARAPTYKLSDAAFANVTEPHSMLVARGLGALVISHVHEISPGVYVIDDRRQNLHPKQRAITGGGDMQVVGYGSRGKSRAIVMRAGGDAVTEGWLFASE